MFRYAGVFHFWPYCCAEQYIGKKYKKTNWLWLFWMFCFEYNQLLEPTEKPMNEAR